MDEMEFNTTETDQVSAPEGTAAQQGRRLDPNHKGGKWKRPVLIVGIVIAVLLAAYLGLCVYANSLASKGVIFPGVTAAGVELGGKDQAQAQSVLNEAVNELSEKLEFPVNVNGQQIMVRGRDAGLTVNPEVTAQLAQGAGENGNFFSRGGKYLSGLLGKKTDVGYVMQIGNEGYIDNVIRQANALVSGGVVESTWEIEETEETAQLSLTKGSTGQSLELDDLRARLEQALESGVAESIEAKIVTTPPQEPDFDKVAAGVDREPLDATLDVETDEVIPHRLGLALDPAKAKAVYDTLAEGESGTVELTVTQPDVTTLELRATLFRDILGEGTSKITGDAARVNNVHLSAAACDGVILLPGQQMSYNQTTGQRTTAKGYREATGYTSKGQELMVGGGVCQPSSTLYLACLNANLEIVNRKNHMYTVSYMPEGIDATVSWPNLDYVFANNTKYPIKVSMTIENKVLTARIYGTKTDDHYVKMESVRLSTTPAGVSYQADPLIPRGTTKVVQGAHTGKKVEVYKNTYAGDGTLISREWVSTDTYRPSDKIIAYNPLDGVPEAGIAPLPDPNVPPVDPGVAPTDPAVPTVAPTAPPVVPTTPPVEPTVPPVEPTPVVTPEPTPAPSAPPVVEPTPTPTPPPVDISLLPPMGLPEE